MAKTPLVIVESPAKARTLSRFLGNKYRVEASYGHIRDLPESAAEVPEEIKKKPWGRLGVDTDGVTHDVQMGAGCTYVDGQPITLYFFPDADFNKVKDCGDGYWIPKKTPLIDLGVKP